MALLQLCMQSDATCGVPSGAFLPSLDIFCLWRVSDLANKAQKTVQQDAELQSAETLPGELHPVLSVCACARCRTLPTRLRRGRRSSSMLSCLRRAAT